MRHDAFDVITEESAYWIGFLMADGCLTHRKRYRNSDGEKEVHLSISERDRGHVEAFRRFLGTSNTISRNTSKGFPGSRPRCRISVTSPRLFDALAVYGVTPRKSLTAKVIGLESNRDFWRGLVDGNGSIVNRRHLGGWAGVMLVGSQYIIPQFSAYCATVIMEEPPAMTPHHSTEGIFNICLSGERGISVVRSLYDGCTVALRRKWDAARQVIKQEGTIQVQREWPRVSVADLKRLKGEHGSWVRVADHLGLSVLSLSEFRRHLRDRGDSGLDDRTFPTNRHGERAPNAKLTDAQALELKCRRRNGESGKSLAREFGVSQSVVSQLCSGKIWSHIVLPVS